MKCDCIKQIEEKVKENWLKIQRENEVFKSATFLDVGFTFDIETGQSDTITTSAIEIEYDYFTKKSRSINKTDKFTIQHSYCPFCGTKIKD
jgi:hypothetical protein